MKHKRRNGLLLFVLLLACSCIFAKGRLSGRELVTVTVDPQKQHLAFYWKDEHGRPLERIANLLAYTKRQGRTLTFAMNGGMFTQDLAPLGLYIQEGKTVAGLNTRRASGNFYLMPNGVFSIGNDGKATICKTEAFVNNGNIRYATQSGPMLVIDGQLHPAFTEGSANLNIRNGVGILPDGRVVFAMSKTEVNFYDFARYFLDLGCKNALYLDGFVSRTYLPASGWVQTEGSLGVMIAVTVDSR